jgi:hypothetical protein
VQAIADGEVAQGIVGYDPIANGQIARDEIAKGEGDPSYRLQLLDSAIPLPKSRGKGARYIPVAKRNERPDAIAWLLRNFPQLSDPQVVKLLATTKETIQKVRDKTHPNTANIKPRDPVTLGLCTQTALNEAVGAANARTGATNTAPIMSADDAA